MIHVDHAVHSPADVVKFRSFIFDMWHPANGPYTRVLAMHEQSNVMMRDTSRGTSIMQRQNLAESQLWWVSAEMMEVVFTAAETVPEDIRCDELPFPSEFGVVVFERPYVGLDAAQPEVEITVNAITWGSEQYHDGDDGVMISSYSELELGADMADHEQSYVQLSGLMGDKVRTECFNGGTLVPKEELSGATYTYLGRSSWRVYEQLGHHPEDLTTAAAESSIEDRRLLAAFFNVLRLEAIAETTTTHAPRPERRNAERQGIDRNVNDISVVTLRRRERIESDGDDEGNEPSDGRFSHRWYVDPFVRWQRVGPGRTQRRLTQVQGHVKGPEDKLFKAKTKVRALKR